MLSFLRKCYFLFYCYHFLKTKNYGLNNDIKQLYNINIIINNIAILTILILTKDSSVCSILTMLTFKLDKQMLF